MAQKDNLHIFVHLGSAARAGKMFKYPALLYFPLNLNTYVLLCSFHFIISS
jgi:hypothetical protein